MSKSLLTAKLVGGGILGTGAVAAGGYGIVEHFRSKESTEQSENQESVNASTQDRSQSADISTGTGGQSEADPVTEDTQTTGKETPPNPPKSPQPELQGSTEGTPSAGETQKASETSGTDSDSSGGEKSPTNVPDQSEPKQSSTIQSVG